MLTGWHVIELSLTVPITNSLAFLFTVLGEWWAEGKVISRGSSQHYMGYISLVSTVWLTGDARYLGWNGIRLGRHRTLCTFEDFVRRSAFL